MKVITETAKYHDDIREVIITAFKNVGEADLVEAIRETPNYMRLLKKSVVQTKRLHLCK